MSKNPHTYLTNFSVVYWEGEIIELQKFSPIQCIVQMLLIFVILLYNHWLVSHDHVFASHIPYGEVLLWLQNTVNEKIEAQMFAIIMVMQK